MVKNFKTIKKRIIEELLLRLGDFLSDLPNYLVNPRPSELTLHYRGLEILRKKLKKEWAGRRVDNAFGQMKRSGYIKEQKVSGHSKYFLTLKGIEKILKLRIKLKLRKEELKQKYLVIIFDIPEAKKELRNLFRERLKEMGVKRLQQSVWITSRDILKEVVILVKIYKLQPYIRFMFVEKVLKGIFLKR